MLEKTLESPLDCKEIQPVHPKGYWSWVFIGRTDVETETPVFWPPDVKSWLIWKDWCWERLTSGGEGDNRGWDVWMASPIQWAWVWVNSGSCWWTGRPGVLLFTGSQRVRHDWAIELNWTETSMAMGDFGAVDSNLSPSPFSIRLYSTVCYCRAFIVSISLPQTNLGDRPVIWCHFIVKETRSQRNQIICLIWKGTVLWFHLYL